MENMMKHDNAEELLHLHHKSVVHNNHLFSCKKCWGHYWKKDLFHISNAVCSLIREKVICYTPRYITYYY